MIYAPFETRQKKLDLTKIDSPNVAIKSFDEIMMLGKTSKITSNPNAQINKNTIAVIMYTSVSILIEIQSAFLSDILREQPENQKAY